MRSRGLCLVMLAGACTDFPAPPSLVGTSTTGASSTSGGTAMADSTTEPLPVIEVLDVRLDFEIRSRIDVLVTQQGEAIEVTIDVDKGYGVVPSAAVVGPGRIDAYPEVGATLYTATLDAPAQADGPCGDEPVSLGFALHVDDDTAFMAGGLTAYCGAGVFFGVPVIEPLRISGMR